jgi:hypothetical protein
MTSLPLRSMYRDAGSLRAAIEGLRRWRQLIIGFALGFPVFFYLAILAILVVKYGHLPNYVTPYDWIANVHRIIVSTSSLRDMLPIIGNEWLLEVGHMDFEYGHGIAEWSLSIIPHKLVLLSLTGALIGLNVGLVADRKTYRTSAQQCAQACGFGLLTSAGALSAGLTNATVFSVACCAAPSWVGSLAVIGVDTSAAFALEPYGLAAFLFGIAALVVSALMIAREGRPAVDRAAPASPQGVVPC